MIEAARILAGRQGRRRNKDILFVAFDAEERPYYLTEDMGSIYFYEHNPRPSVECGIFLDLCGHDFPLPGNVDIRFTHQSNSEKRDFTQTLLKLNR